MLREKLRRGSRYARDVMYGTTHTVLPERNGIRPNTLHMIFDVVTAAILIVLSALTAQQW
ncbi:MAG TPA: hypothetical protein VN881_13130 [Candidatus Acidoferrales bacterium]|nr:hypothetical protein [Candidatus Acidoferrales bacterium]